MAKRLMIAGNWKMNKTVAEALELVQNLTRHVAELSVADVVICPPCLALDAVRKAVAGTPLAVGAQNVHWAESGAFTGEISAAMLKEIRVKYVIIGHSERRQHFGETDATVNLRLKAALAAALKPIVCVGETLAQRQAGEMETVVAKQLEAGLAGLSAADMQNTILAYEPIWAIGTGLTATPVQADEMHAFLRRQIRDRFDKVAGRTRILYGGSVKPGNAAALLRRKNIDGALVGGASLDAKNFLKIVTTGAQLAQ